MAYPMHRGALIGCGFIANQKHLPALAKLENRIQLVAFCDLVEERAQKAAKESAPQTRPFTPITGRCSGAVIWTLCIYLRLTARTVS